MVGWFANIVELFLVLKENVPVSQVELVVVLIRVLMTEILQIDDMIILPVGLHGAHYTRMESWSNRTS